MAQVASLEIMACWRFLSLVLVDFLSVQGTRLPVDSPRLRMFSTQAVRYLGFAMLGVSLNSLSTIRREYPMPIILVFSQEAVVLQTTLY